MSGSFCQRCGRPVLIDFFSCQGGSSYGYDQAGFCVVGVDKDPQPLFPFAFVQADAVEDFEALVKIYDPWAAVGSPPCQSRSYLKYRTGRGYVELVPPFREKLLASGLPYVIENVEARPDNPEAALIDPILLCGSMFDPAPTVDGLLLKRHRLFEAGNGFTLEPLADDSCRKRTGVEWRATINVHGGGAYRESRRPDGTRDGHGNKASNEEAKALLGIHWMTQKGMNESIPPRYAKFVGDQLMDYVIGAEAAA